MKKVIAILIFLPLPVIAGEMWLGEWLQKNEPIVKKYLLNLPDSKMGKTIKGVALTDGKLSLKKLYISKIKVTLNLVTIFINSKPYMPVLLMRIIICGQTRILNQFNSHRVMVSG